MENIQELTENFLKIVENRWLPKKHLRFSELDYKKVFPKVTQKEVHIVFYLVDKGTGAEMTIPFCMCRGRISIPFKKISYNFPHKPNEDIVSIEQTTRHITEFLYEVMEDSDIFEYAAQKPAAAILDLGGQHV